MGQIYEGTVTRILDFGAIVQLLPGKDGLLHISQIANVHVDKVTDYLKEGQKVRVKVIEADEKGRVRLSMKALINDEKRAAQEGSEEEGAEKPSSSPLRIEAGPLFQKWRQTPFGVTAGFSQHLICVSCSKELSSSKIFSLF